MPRRMSLRRPTVRVAALLALAEAALLYSVYDPNNLATTGAVAAWTIITIYVVVTLVHYAESGRRHREQVAARLQAEMRDSLDEVVNSLASAISPQERDLSAARDAVRLVRDRYDTPGSPPQGGSV